MISVCLTTYNGEKYLEKQLISILDQLQKEDELLISDDGSTDNTIAIIEKICREKCTLFRNHFNSPIRNFEFLLSKASQPIIALSDQDDIWLPNKRAVIANSLGKRSKSCLLMNGELINEAGQKSGLTTFEKWRSRKGFWKNLIRNTFMGSSMAFTSDLLIDILPFPKNIAMHDWWIGLISEHRGKVILYDEPTIQYRIHGSNLSLQGSKFGDKLLWRVQILRALMKRLKIK